MLDSKAMLTRCSGKPCRISIGEHVVIRESPCFEASVATCRSHMPSILGRIAQLLDAGLRYSLH